MGTKIPWMGALWALIFFVLLAIVELITDQLPSTPPRTKGPGLIARILMADLRERASRLLARVRWHSA